MKRLFFMIITLFVFILNPSHSYAYEKEIKGLSSGMAENIVKAGRKTIAVVDFTDLQGNVTELGRFLAEEFSVAFAGAGKGFEVVDRTHLKSILAEHKLSATGIIDPQTARKLGQVAGVDALITGTITPFGDSIRLSIKILDTATAKVIGASSGDIAKTKGIEELLARGIEEGVPTTLPNTQSSIPKPKTVARLDVVDFRFEAKECKIQGEKVVCTISVTNNAQKTRRLQLFACEPGRSLLVDNRGNQYNSEEVWFGGKGGKAYGVDQEVPPGLPMNIVLVYREIVSSVAYVNVVIDCWENVPFKAVLRNIPLTK